MRMYQPFWLALKQNGYVVINVPKSTRWQRILRAVSKEKWLDPHTHVEVWRKKRITYHYTEATRELLLSLDYAARNIIKKDL